MALTRDGNSTLFSTSMAGTLRLIVYLALACVLMVVDYRGHWLAHVRYAAAVVIEPVYKLAGLPSELIDSAQVAFASRKKLTVENRNLRQDLLLANARLNRMSAVAKQNHKLKQLLETRHSLDMKVQLARLIDVDLGAWRHRIMLNVGARQGVTSGQVVIDANGIMGQVVEVLPDTCVAILVTDPDSAVPVVVERSGQRTVAYGSRAGDQLLLPNIPVSADVRVGDQLLTSGLGGRYPPGFPVGRVVSVQPDASGMFLKAVARPAAHLTRSSNVLLLRDLAPPVGPPAPAASMGPPMSLAPPGVREAHGEKP
ncbi:MAG TPA: rod shape-determining protein MreC [Oleiagrimonas sp.]|nr:rod shape-determining protein MreC [Oleiagrimonas sp.]